MTGASARSGADEALVVMALPPAARQLLVVAMHRHITLMRREQQPVPASTLALLRQLLAMAGQGWTGPAADEDDEHLGAMPPLMVNRGEAGRLIGVSERTVRRLIDDKRLPAVQVGKRVMVRVSDLNDYVEALPTDQAEKSCSRPEQLAQRPKEDS